MRGRYQLFLCLPAFCNLAQAQVSDPLDQWEFVAQGRSGELRGLAYKDGTFVGVAYGPNMAVSTNGGVDWLVVRVNLTNYYGCMAVAAGAGQFVAVGWKGNILSSPDGLQWTRRLSGAPTSEDEYWAVTYAGGRFVAAGWDWDRVHSPTNSVAISSNGITWEEFYVSPYLTPRNIAYGNGTYVVAGAPEGSMYSTNGRDWKALTNVVADGIAYGAGQFVAAGGTNGYISSNGVSWSKIALPSPGTGYQSFYTGTYANGTFVLAGFCDSCPHYMTALVVTSTNGREWTLRPILDRDARFRDIVFVDGRFYMVSDLGGEIWRSGRMEPNTRPAITDVARAGGQTSLSFSTVAGFHYEVECADRLDPSTWTRCAQHLFATEDRLTITDFNATTQTRFYRVRVE